MVPAKNRRMQSTQHFLAGRRLVVLTVLLGGFTAFGPLSMDLYLPAFPGLAADLHASQAEVQLTLTADVIGLVVGQLVLGPLSDAHGRRGLLIGSTLVCGAASALCALAPSAAWLAGWRLVQGIRGRRHRAGPRRRGRHRQRGGGGTAVLALHDRVERRADRRPGARRRPAGRDGELAPDVLAAGRDQPGARCLDLAGDPETLPARAGTRAACVAPAARSPRWPDRVFAGYALTVAFAYARCSSPGRRSARMSTACRPHSSASCSHSMQLA